MNRGHAVSSPAMDPARRVALRRAHGTVTARASLVAGILVTAAGCAWDGPGAEGAGVVRDSAGVRIVEHDAGQPAATWRVGAEPLLDVGRLEGEPPYLFESVSHAARLGDGTLAVLEGGSGEVRLFDAQGAHLRTLGGSGGGPGEFRSPLRFWERGDSLVVFDWRDSRITLLPLDGSPARTFRTEGVPRAYNAEVWFTGDRVVVPGKSPTPPSVELEPIEVVVSYLAVPLDGTAPDTVARVSGGMQRRVELDTSRGRAITADVSPLLFQAIPTGAAGGGRLWVGSGRRPAVRRYGLADGLGDGLDVEIRWAQRGQPATEELVDRYVEHRAADLEDPGSFRETMRDFPVADTVPYYDGLMVDDAGRIWVKGFAAAPEGGVDRWTVYDAGGARAAAAELPADVTVFQVGEDWVLGVRLDGLDVPHVVVLPLVKGRG